MPGEPGMRFEVHITLEDRDRVPAEQRDGRAGVEAGPGRAHVTRIAGFGSKPPEAGQDGVGSAVAESGGTERAKERTADAGDLGQAAGRDQVFGEHARSTQRSHRVGTGWTHADGEEVESRDGRCHTPKISLSAGKAPSGRRPDASHRNVCGLNTRATLAATREAQEFGGAY
ncbi:hypothetical protein CLE01_24850 [Cryobacterium levicorallinum]|nr:hypothetical protein CLE01_24850 [Cryobacterium levicorallinum]